MVSMLLRVICMLSSFGFGSGEGPLVQLRAGVGIVGDEL
jgi:hypothetical protein